LRQRRSRGALAAGLLWLAALLRPASAHANDFDQFQNARVAYESLNYALAADLFQNLLATTTASDRRPVVVESRKYLAAAYLFLGRRPEAEAQFELLLRAAPDYVIDPVAFPDEVVRTFAALKARTERERLDAEQARARADAARAGKQQLAERTEQDRLQRLIRLASTQRVEQTRSRWVAMVPFGIGQFQNGHNDLGLVLAISEGTLLATSVVTFFLHDSLRGQEPQGVARDNARLAETVFRFTNEISLGLFAAIAIAGVVDAQARFVPSRSIDRPRPLPEDLKHLQLSIGPGSIGLRGQF
jgi:tetratricopeptide (TPR) repeat protein